MKVFIQFFLFFYGIACLGQYQFKGTFPKSYNGQSVFLSLVEDYRKVDRVYNSQVIQKTTIDSLGNFLFAGNRLADKNRMYRIHIDDCPDSIPNAKSNYLAACTRSQRVLFLANNRSTLVFPTLSNDQPLCEINGDSPNTGALLEIDHLKEAMILDVMDSHSTTDEQLKYKTWFDELQRFALEREEPLVELYVHDFLSDKKNESHAFYLKDLSENPYYQELGARLENSYGNAPFVTQYLLELKADALLTKGEQATTATPFFLLGIALLVLLGLFIFLKYRPFQNTNPIPMANDLTPQEQRVYKAIQDNKSNKEIAMELFISTSTVKTHINNIYKKLEVSSRADIIKNPPRV